MEWVEARDSLTKWFWESPPRWPGGPREKEREGEREREERTLDGGERERERKRAWKKARVYWYPFSGHRTSPNGGTFVLIRNPRRVIRSTGPRWIGKWPVGQQAKKGKVGGQAGGFTLVTRPIHRQATDEPPCASCAAVLCLCSVSSHLATRLTRFETPIKVPRDPVYAPPRRQLASTRFRSLFKNTNERLYR